MSWVADPCLSYPIAHHLLPNIFPQKQINNPLTLFGLKKTTTPFQKHKIIYKINMCHCFPLSQFLGYSVHLHPCVLQGFWVSQNCPWRLDGRPQTERTARSPAAFTASCWTCLSRRFCMPSAVVFPRRPKNSDKASATSRGGKRTSCV